MAEIQNQTAATPEPEQYVTIQGAAAYLGVSRDKIWRLKSEGQLSAVQNPLNRRQWLIKVRDLDAFRYQVIDVKTDLRSNKVI